jgi:hypothetical protein
MLNDTYTVGGKAKEHLPVVVFILPRLLPRIGSIQYNVTFKFRKVQ